CRAHASRARKRRERVLPRTRLSRREHRLEPLARFLAFVDRATVQWAGTSGNLRKGSVKLELQNEREKVACIRRVVGNVVFGSGIEKVLAASRRRLNALVLQTQIPPGLVVAIRCDFAAEYL